MPRRALDQDLIDRFFEELSQTLDITSALHRCSITEDEARAIFNKFVSKKEKAGPFAGGFELFVDGASRGNPGEAGAGAVIKDGAGKTIRRLKKYLGVTTNNMAEYNALLMGLEAARSMGIKELSVFADSELMIKQLKGEYKVRSEDLRPLYEKAVGLLKVFERYKVRHIYRENNSAADALANEAIDSRDRSLFD